MKWKRWILELLPLRRRTLMVYAWCMVLVFPVIRLYDEFETWRAKMRVKTGGTPQVCMLRRIIKDELGIDVLIEEGNGKPADFIIKTSFVNVDMERQLFALLDRYKLAGKSYYYENAEIAITNQWMAYVCERAEMTAEWTGFACEYKERIYNTITTEFVYHVYSGFEYLKVTPAYPLESDITARIYVNNETVASEYNIIRIRSGSNEIVIYQGVAVGTIGNDLRIELDIIEDEKYIYNVNIIKTTI